MLTLNNSFCRYLASDGLAVTFDGIRGFMRKETYKNADYPNRKPAWQKHPIKFKKKLTQIERVLAKLDWEKLAK